MLQMGFKPMVAAHRPRGVLMRSAREGSCSGGRQKRKWSGPRERQFQRSWRTGCHLNCCAPRKISKLMKEL